MTSLREIHAGRVLHGYWAKVIHYPLQFLNEQQKHKNLVTAIRLASLIQYEAVKFIKK